MSKDDIPRDLNGKPVERPYRSAFVEAYEKRKRWTMTVDMAPAIGHSLTDHDGSEITEICYRTNTKSEDDTALAAAHAYISRLSKLAEKGADAFLADGRALNDASAIYALYRCCRDPRDPERPLFVTPGWMRDNLDTDEISGLLNGYNLARARKHGLPFKIEDVTLDGLREMLVAAADTELPERLLSMYTWEYLASLLTLICQRWDEDRRLAADVVSGLLKGEEAGTIREAEQLVEDWAPGPAEDEGDAGTG